MTKKRFLIGVIGIVGVCALSIWGILRFNRPLVSVVMCVYNGEKSGELAKSMPSILNQSWKDFEFVIVEDGSEDNSWALLQEYAKKDPRIKLVKNDKNRGISYSRNRGNKLARGKYIMIMDQDDFSLPDRILKQADFMEKQPWLDVVATPSKTEAPWNAFYNEDDTKWALLFNNNYGHPNLMVKRSFLEKHHIQYNEFIKCANDYDWLVQIFESGGRFGTMYEELFEYAGAKLSKDENCDLEAVDVMQKWLPEKEYIELRKTKFQGDRNFLRNRMCRTAQILNQTKQYHHLFTPGYLEYVERNMCVEPEEK